MQKEEIVIVVPIYKKQLSDLEKISLTQLQRVLGDYPRVFQAPESLEFDYGCLGEGFSVERFPDEYFTGVYSYSHLMLEADFYRRFDKYKYMLIYQLDAFVFSDKLLEFCEMGYDYIGAPVYPLTPHWHAIGTCVGNGGFSLRKIDSAIQMLEYSHSWLQTDPFKDVLVDWEDLFWAYCGMKKNLSFQIPPKSIALKFSVQDNVSHAYKKMPAEMPFGCHGWYKDNFDFWKQRIQACGYDLSQYKSTSNGHSMRSMFTTQLWRLHKYINVPILYYYLRNNRHEKALHLMLTWLEKYDAKSLVWRNTAEFFICIWRICRAGWMEEKKFIYLLMEKTVKEILCRVINTGVYGVWKIQMLMVLCKHFDSIDRDARYGLQNCLENIVNSRWQEFVIDDDISYYLYNIENDILPDKNLQMLLSVYYDGKINEQELLYCIETKTMNPSKVLDIVNKLK